jgi:hypothetical protein
MKNPAKLKGYIRMKVCRETILTYATYARSWNLTHFVQGRRFIALSSRCRCPCVRRCIIRAVNMT